jgi:hypothetical protein
MSKNRANFQQRQQREVIDTNTRLIADRRHLTFENENGKRGKEVCQKECEDCISVALFGGVATGP